MKKYKILICATTKLVLLSGLLVAATGFLIYGRTPPWFLSWPTPLKNLLITLSAPDGLRFAITATGVISFALTYINSARIHRVKGILIGKVIHARYPMYGLFFLLHGAFVILGIYSCAVRVRSAGALCAAGVLFCLIYAVNLTIRTAFGDSYGEKLVQRYIKQVIDFGTDEEKYESICTMARYIGERFSSEYWQFDPNSSISGIKDDLDQLLSLLEAAIPADAQAQSRFNLLSDFDQLFAPDGAKAAPEYILFSIPAVKAKKAAFQKAVEICGNMWRSLLDELSEWQMEAKLAYLMLCRAEFNADQERRPSAAALCCGLLFYLYNPTFSNFDHTGDTPRALASSIGQDGPMHCAYVLQQINRLRRQPTDQVAIHLQTACTDMAVIGLCLSALEQTITTDPVNHKTMLYVVHETMRDRPVVWQGRHSIYQYLCFAQIIATLSHYRDDRFNMLQTAPLIFQVVKQWLCAEPRKRGKVDIK